MLKAMFGLLGLLIVLAVIGSLAKNQLSAIGRIGSGAGVEGTAAADPASGRAVGGAQPDAAAGTAAGGPPDAQAQIRGLQNAVRERTVDALQQGMQRSERSQP